MSARTFVLASVAAVAHGLSGIVGGEGSLPPSYVQSVSVKNADPYPVQVTALYRHNDGKITPATEFVDAGETAFFPEKTENMGSWVASMPVVKVHVMGGESNAVQVLEAPFGVNGIVSHVQLVVSTQEKGMLNVAALQEGEKGKLIVKEKEGERLQHGDTE